MPMLLLVSFLIHAAAHSAPPLATDFAGIPNTGYNVPDPTIAVGPSNVVVIVNSTVAIYTKGGGNVTNRTLTSWFASVSPPGAPFSPKLVYDASSGHWVMLALARRNPRDSFYLISVSTTNDPTRPWWNWIWDAGMDGNTASGYYADSPGLGYSDEAIYITSNQFDSHDNFQYAKLRIIPKALLYNGNNALTGWDVWNARNANGTTVFGWKPAQAQSILQGNYLINTAPGGSNFVSLWKVTNPLGTNPGPTVSLQATLLVQPYTLPGNAAQKGGTAVFNTGNCRAQDVQFQNGKLVTAFTEGFNWGSGTVSAVRTLVLDAATSSVDVDRRFGADKLWHYYPAIVRDPAGNMAMVFNRSGTNEYAGAHYTAWLAGGTNWESSAELKTGQAYYGSGINYWGNYSGAALDPTKTTRAWVYGTYTLSASQWGTWIGEVPLGVTNDTCAGAIPLSAGRVFTLNTSSAGSESDPTTICGVPAGKGVWFSFTPPTDGQATISTCGADFNTVLQVYRGTCGSLTSVTCTNDNGPACSGTQASVSFQASAATTYLIFAAGLAGASGNLSILATFCAPPAITVSASCPSTPPVPGGVLVLSGQVCNTGGGALTNVTVFADRVLTNGTTLVVSYALLTNGECRGFSASIRVPPDACSITAVLTANGTNTCPLAGPAFVTAQVTNTCLIQNSPVLRVVKICPAEDGRAGEFIDFTGFVVNDGNVSLTSVTVSNCVISGAADADTCRVLSRIPRLDPGQTVQFGGREGPINQGTDRVINTVTAVGFDPCGRQVSANNTVACPVCQPPTFTGNPSIFTTLIPEGILLSASVFVEGTPPFGLDWTIGVVTINAFSSQSGPQFLSLVIPFDQVPDYITNAAFFVISTRVSNACGSDGGFGSGSSPCIVCLSRGVPVSRNSTLNPGGGAGVLQDTRCGNTQAAAKWYSLASVDNGMADLSIMQTSATNGFMAVFEGENPFFVEALTNACTNTVASRQTRLQFEVRANRQYQLAIRNESTITNMTWGFVPQISGSANRSNGQYQLRSSVGPALRYTFQASTALASQAAWSNLYSATFPTNGARYTDTNATNFSRRFYRILAGP